MAFVVGLMTGAGSVGASPEALRELLAKEPPPSGVAASICFAPLCGTEGRVAYDADRALPPASVEKIVTSAAALDLLGPDWRFATTVWADKAPHDGTVEGNLYLDGNGDPFLVTERLWLLAREAANRGVRRVTGALVVVAEADAELGVLRALERTQSPYAAPVSRLAVNFNSLAFLVRPAERAGGAATVWLDPFPIPGMSFEVNVKTAAEGGTTSVTAQRREGAEPEVWDVRGEIAAGSEPYRAYRAATDPALLAGGTLAGLLAQNGVEVPGVTRGKRPEGAISIAVLSSLSLGSLIRNMNLWSNNFMADLLLLSLGDSANASSGRARISRWLAEKPGLDPVPVVADGSGLSPRNRISAAQIVALLAWAHGQERIAPDLFASFPRPGGEGTLEKRFRGPEAVGVRGKTGTLGESGVSSIAGTVDHPTQGRFVFCILQQSPPDPGKAVPAMRAREEQWIRAFVAP